MGVLWWEGKRKEKGRVQRVWKREGKNARKRMEMKRRVGSWDWEGIFKGGRDGEIGGLGVVDWPVGERDSRGIESLSLYVGGGDGERCGGVERGMLSRMDGDGGGAFSNVIAGGCPNGGVGVTAGPEAVIDMVCERINRRSFVKMGMTSLESSRLKRYVANMELVGLA